MSKNRLLNIFENRNKIIALILLGLLAAIVYWLSVNVIWIGDDLNYQYIIHSPLWAAEEQNPRPIECISDILTSQYYHFFYINGRLITHFAVQLFCGILGHVWFGIFNAIFWAGFILMIVKNAGYRWTDIRVLLSAVLLAWLSYETKFTPSCQIGYIWTGTIILGFIYLFLHNKPYPKWFSPIFLIFGFIAGNSQEAYVIGVGFALTWYFIKNKRLSIEQWLLVIGFGFGAMLLCLSPAAISRVSEESIGYITTTIITLFTFRAFYLLVGLILYKKYKKIGLIELYTQHTFYFNILIGCILFNLAIGIGTNRQLFGVELISAILLLRILKGGMNNWWTGIIFLMVCVLVWFQITIVTEQKHQFEKIEQMYRESQNGIVYYDFKLYGLLTNYLPVCTAIWVDNVNSAQTGTIRMYYSQLAPGLQSLKIHPTVLRDFDVNNPKNKYYLLPNQPKGIIFVQTQEQPAKFVISRKLFGFDLSPVEVNLEYLILKTETCRVAYRLAPPMITYENIEIIDAN